MCVNFALSRFFHTYRVVIVVAFSSLTWVANCSRRWCWQVFFVSTRESASPSAHHWKGRRKELRLTAGGVRSILRWCKQAMPDHVRRVLEKKHIVLFGELPKVVGHGDDYCSLIR